jgi:hypothetical protein
MTTAAMIVELRRSLGELSSSDLPEADALDLLNRSYWEILDKFPFREKEKTATFSTVAGTRSYNVPGSFEALRQLSIHDPDDGAINVLARDSIYSSEEERETSSDAQGRPERYFRDGGLFRLDPVPDKVYTLTIKYWTTLSDLDNSPTSDPLIPRSWHEIIVFGAIWRGFLQLRDFEASTFYKQQQIALINSSVPVEAKEEIDSRLAGVECPGRDYDW